MEMDEITEFFLIEFWKLRVYRKKKVKCTFKMFISCLVQWRSQIQHTQYFKAHSVNSCAYLEFLFFLISQRERFSRNKKLMGCSWCRALFCADGHWPARAFGNAPTETERLKLAAQQDKSLSGNSWDITQRETVTPLEQCFSVSSTGVFSLSYSPMEINSVTLNMTKLSRWDAFWASFNAHKEKFCKAMLIIRWNCHVWVNISM